MLREEPPAAAAESSEAPEIGVSEVERRRAFRRRLPFGRGAVLEVGARAHIVGVADLSVTGAYLSTRAQVGVGEVHLLRLLVLPERVELALRAQVVRVAQSGHESCSHPRGVAVRFTELDEAARRRLEQYVAHEPGPARR